MWICVAFCGSIQLCLTGPIELQLVGVRHGSFIEGADQFDASFFGETLSNKLNHAQFCSSFEVSANLFIKNPAPSQVINVILFHCLQVFRLPKRKSWPQRGTAECAPSMESMSRPKIHSSDSCITAALWRRWACRTGRSPSATTN